MDNEIFAPVNQRVGGVSTRAWYCAAFFATAIAMLLALSCGIREASATEALDEEANWNIAVDPIGKDEGYSCVLYNNSNGLPTSEANAIAETSEGFIWIGSYSGLIRYDGNEFTRIDSTTGVASVMSLHVDAKNRLWVGTNDSGIALMEEGSFRLFNKTHGLKSLSVRTITEDPAGNIYAATTEGIAVIDPNMNVSTIADPRIADAYIRDLETGPDGVLYGSTMDDELFTLRNGVVESFVKSESVGVPDVITVHPDWDNPGSVYVGSKSSTVYHGDLASGFANPQAINVAPLTYVKSIQNIQGQLWICADNGIGVVTNGALAKLDGIPLNDSIDHMMVDYAGDLWFTSSRQGVMKIVPNRFSDIYEKYGLQDAVVNTTCLSGGLLYIGTDAGLTVLSSSGAVDAVPITRAVTASGADLGQTDLMQLLAGSRIRSIVHDSKGNLWFSTYGAYGLVRFDGSTATSFTANDGLPSGRVRTVCERQDGAMLAACSNGVAVIQGNSVTGVYDEDSGIGSAEVLTIAQANNGDMVFGTDGGGVYIMSGDTVKRIGVEEGLSSDVVMRVKKDPTRDLFWIVTSNSIAFMTADYQVNTIRNFPYSNNFDLYESSKGEMWVLSSNGVYVVSVDDLLANGALSPVFYGRDNGLPCIATANSYSDISGEGDLYIAGSTGVAKVNIEETFENVSNVKMAVPYVEVDGKLIFPNPETGVITIPADAQKVTVHGFVYTYALTNPQVTYSLTGFDQGQTTVTRSELAPVDYTNLAGGDYQFVMQLSDSMGHGSQIISVPIVKELSIHEMLWFRIGCVVAVIVAVALVVALIARRRIRAYQRKVEEDRIFIREVTEAFARIIDMKDEYTNGHSKRVADYTSMLARELGYDEESVEKYYNIALLHDIGKIGIPSSVLNKPERLTDEEYEIMKSHAEKGYNALKDISIMPELATGAGYHHERPDGKGYPRGLKGDEIPRVAQIIAVADAFDAMYSNRKYRSAMNFEKAVSIIHDVRGTQLTADVVDAFLRLVDQGEFRDPDDTGGGTMEDIDNTGRGSGDN